MSGLQPYPMVGQLTTVIAVLAAVLAVWGLLPPRPRVRPGNPHPRPTTPGRAGRDWVGPDRAGPDRLGTDRAGPDRLGTDRAGPDRLGPARLGPDRAEPDRLGPDRVGPGRVGTDPRAGWVHWIRGRPDAMSMRLRTGLAVPATIAVAVLLQALGLPPWLGWLVAGLTAGVGWVTLGRLESDDHRRRRLRLVADLPDTCELLAACLDAGLPLRRACEVVAATMPGPVAEDLGQVSGLVAAGVDEARAWRTLAGDRPWRRIAVDLARSADSGTAVGAVLHHHAEAARAAAERVRELRARTAGVRSVLPLTVCFLPAFFLVGVVPLVAGLLDRVLGW